MCPRIDGEYSGSSSVGSQPTATLSRRWSLVGLYVFRRFSPSMFDDRKERFTVYPLLCPAPIATGFPPRPVAMQANLDRAALPLPPVFLQRVRVAFGDGGFRRRTTSALRSATAPAA